MLRRRVAAVRDEFVGTVLVPIHSTWSRSRRRAWLRATVTLLIAASCLWFPPPWHPLGLHVERYRFWCVIGAGLYLGGVIGCETGSRGGWRVKTNGQQADN